VLIYPVGDHVPMVAYLLIALLLLVALLAPVYGADSRVDEVGRRRRLGH
jgi:hypothetical protein